jgi:hypothetical protein
MMTEKKLYKIVNRLNKRVVRLEKRVYELETTAFQIEILLNRLESFCFKLVKNDTKKGEVDTLVSL